MTGDEDCDGGCASDEEVGCVLVASSDCGGLRNWSQVRSLPSLTFGIGAAVVIAGARRAGCRETNPGDGARCAVGLTYELRTSASNPTTARTARRCSRTTFSAITGVRPALTMLTASEIGSLTRGFTFDKQQRRPPATAFTGRGA